MASKVKNFILEMLSALTRGISGGRFREDIEEVKKDDVVSSIIDNNNKILVKTNAFNENSSLALDSIYNFLSTNSLLKQSQEQQNPTKIKSSAIPNLDNYFLANRYIPVRIINPEVFDGMMGDEGYDFDIEFPDRKKPRIRPRTPRTPPGTGPGGRPGGFNPDGRPSTGGPARQPRIPPGTVLPQGYTRNSAGRIINAETGRFASATEILDEIERAGNWARYSKLLKFLRAAGYVGVAMAFIDPIYAMYIGAPESEIRKQLAGAMGSIGGATLGAIIGAAGITAIPVVGQSGIANIAGGLVGGIVGAVAGEWVIESLIDYLLDTSSEETQPEQPQIENPLPNYGEGDESYNGSVQEFAPPVYDPITGVQISGDELSNLEIPDLPEINQPAIASEMIPEDVVPASYDPTLYAEQETAQTTNTDDIEKIKADEIHFVSDLIRFVYGTLLRNGSDPGSEQNLTGQPSPTSGATSFPAIDAAYQQPGGTVTPQEGPTPQSPTAPTPEISGTPTEAKEFLSSISANRTREGDTTNLNDDFASKLASLIRSAPPDIQAGLGVGSAYRSAQRQAEIISENMGKYGFGASDIAAWESDVSSMGPEAAGARWRSRFRSAGLTANIGMPGGSNHQRGLAVDLTYNGAMLKPGNVPSNVLSWVHSNAGRFGLHFPMGHEPWHIEPINARANQPPTAVADTETTPSASPPTGAAGGPQGTGTQTAEPTTVPANTGQAISAKSTETFANARIPNSAGPGPIAQPTPIVTASTIDSPFETAGIDRPLAAMTASEQSIFERSGMFA